MRRSVPTALAAAGLVALAGCGSNDAVSEGRQQATQARDQAAQAAKGQQLSPEEQRLLKRTQALTADVADTAQGYANNSLSRSAARDQLARQAQRAQQLAQRTQALPGTATAREQLTQMTSRLQSTTKTLQSTVAAGGNAAQVQRSVDRLRRSTRRTFDALRDQLPAGARKRADDLLSQLGG